MYLPCISASDRSDENCVGAIINKFGATSAISGSISDTFSSGPPPVANLA